MKILDDQEEEGEEDLGTVNDGDSEDEDETASRLMVTRTCVIYDTLI